MITNPSLPPLDRLAELADYFRTAEVSADALVLSKADVAEFRTVCEGMLTPNETQVNCHECHDEMSYHDAKVVCMDCWDSGSDALNALDAIRRLV